MELQDTALNEELKDKDIEDMEPRRRPVVLPPVETFEEANLHPDLLREIVAMGWTTPTPVQQKCLPYTLTGRDVAGFAQTGTGKTGVFLTTIADRILKTGERFKMERDSGAPAAVILAPTRELAMQITADAEGLFKNLGLTAIAVFGGVDYDKQARQIKEGADIIVATPGRLKDYYQKKVITLSNVKQFVCDEADRMFDMGFIEDVEFFLDKMGENVQKLLFSATTNEQVKELAFEYLEMPEYISVNPEVLTPENIEQHAIICEAKQKLKVMMGLFKDHNPRCAIIFTNTKLVAEWLHYKMTKNGFECDLITGDLPQRKRIALIHRIKEGKLNALIATDVASRGLHIAGVTHVYNFDLPDDPSNYVHRIGRTARAGAHGCSYSLVCEDYGHNLEAIQQLLGDKIRLDSEWFDEKYLTIEDKAGNPYKDPEFKSNSLPRERDARPGASRGGERQGRGGGGRDRGGRPQERRDGQAAGNGRGERPRHDRKRDGEPSQQDRGRQAQGGGKRGDQRRGRPDGQRQDGRRGQQGRSEHERKQPHQNRGDRSRHPEAAAAAKPVAAPSSVTGMIKKMFSVLFGKK